MPGRAVRSHLWLDLFPKAIHLACVCPCQPWVLRWDHAAEGARKGHGTGGNGCQPKEQMDISRCNRRRRLGEELGTELPGR